MRTEHLLISLVGLCLAFLMLFGGIFLFFSPYVPLFERTLHSLFFQHLMGVSYFGLALFFLGVMFLSMLVWLNRRRYLLLKMGTVSVEDRLIAHFAKTSLQTLFPDQPIECDVIVKKKKKLEILANVPFVQEEDQERTFKEIERVLVSVLQKQCQYDRDFTLNVNFLAE